MKKAEAERSCNMEWKTISASRHGPGIPPLGSNAYSCSCSSCKSVLRETTHWTSITKEEIAANLKIGDRVLVNGTLPGVVQYVGDLDSNYTHDQIFVGVKLDDPVGEHDGIYYNKRFFKCPNKHGVIVPIEQIHLLLSRDGRSVEMKPFLPCKYFSMPELMETEKRVVETPFKAKSDITVTSLDDYIPIGLSFSAEKTAAGMISTGSMKEKMSSDTGRKVSFASVKKAKSKPSGLLISTKAATSNKPAVSTSSSAALSQGFSKTESGVADSDNKKESTPVTNPEVKPEDIASKSVGAQVKSAHSVLSKSSSAKSADPRRIMSAKFTAGARPQSCKSSMRSPKKSPKSSSSVNPESTSSGNLDTQNLLKASSSSNHTKSQSTAVSSASMKIKDVGKEDATTTEKADKAVQSLTTQEAEDKKESPKPDGATESTPESSGNTTTPKSQCMALVPMPSYTRRLLSSLPPADTFTPLSAEAQLREIQEFGVWMEVWGGGMRAWSMAQTLQKLKDGLRRGTKEVIWQQTLDELEKDDEFAPRIRRIKALRMQIEKVRNKRELTEKKIREMMFRRSETQVALEKVLEEIKAEDKLQEELVEKLRNHPLARKLKIMELPIDIDPEDLLILEEIQ